MLSASLFAAPVTKEDARKKALSFLNQKNRGGKRFTAASVRPCSLKLSRVSDTQAYYVFNVGEGAGYVIVSGDDRAEEILGYTDTGSFDINRMPDNMKTWLQGYERELTMLAQTDADADNEVRPIRQAIPAMITTKWNQMAPYNNMCPMFDGDFDRRPTGCVATAMAQVMYYHKWPQGKMKKGINRYTYVDEEMYGGDGSTREISYSPSTKFDWDKMQDIYQEGRYSDEAAEAVAKLMAYCGKSVQMCYYPQVSGSLSHDIPLALRQYFDYDAGIRILNRYGYMTSDWEDIMYEELKNNRPILYSGSSDDMGHQFVCDGYENGFFHINWGWGGTSDGFFKLSSLSPSIHGVGGAENGMSFAKDQWAIIGIQKNEGGKMPGVEIVLQSLGYYYAPEESETDAGIGKTAFCDGVAELKLNAHFGLSGEKTDFHATAIALFNADGTFKRNIAENNEALFIAGGSEIDLDYDGVYDQDIKQVIKFTREDLPNDGSYYVKAFYKLKPEDKEWIPALNSEKVFVRLDVKGDTIQAVNCPEVDFTLTDIEVKGNLTHDGSAILSGIIHNHGEEVNGMVTPAFYGIDMEYPGVPVYLKKNGREKVEISIKFTPYAEELEQYFEGRIPVGMALNGKPSEEYKLVSLNKVSYVPADLDFEQKDMNADGVHVCGGDFIEIPLDVTNNSKEHDYANMVRLLVIQIDKATQMPYIYRQTEHFVNIPKASKKEVTLKVEDVDMDAAYAFFLFYQNDGQLELYGGQDEQGNPKKTFLLYVTVDAAKCWKGTGEKFCSRINSENMLDIPSDVCFVEMPHDLGGINFKLGDNPNTVYKFGETQEIPSDFAGKNVMNGDMGAEINIVQGRDYYIPYGIYADKATYTCVAGMGAQGIYVPFRIGKVMHDGRELTIATDDNDEADICMLNYVAESKDCVYFDYASVMPDATPMIYMADKKLAGEKLVFAGSEVMLATTDYTVYGDIYDLHGSANNANAGEGYVFGGDKFTAKDDVCPGSFGIYLTAVGSDKPAEVKIELPEKVKAGIDDIDVEDAVCNVYDAAGVMVKKNARTETMLEGLPAGVYIVKGNKYIK